MKYIVLALLLIGCSQSSPDSSHLELQKVSDSVDSLIIKNQRNIDSVSVQLTKTDSAVVEKVEQTVQKIGNLETENKQLKDENNALKTELNTVKRSGKPYKLLPVSPD
jgi:hypothetical protein